MRKFFSIVTFFFFTSVHSYGQDTLKSLELNGYLSGLQNIMFQEIDKEWTTENLIHNRLNFNWYPTKNLNVSVQLRNRLIYGETVNYNPYYAGAIGHDDGWFDFSFNICSGKSFVLNTAIDRFWLQYTSGRFEATIGRQRINWGQTYVWNTNDIFNVYSYFDVDYIERPGSDAVRLKYYSGYTSSFELTAKIDSSDRITAAGMFRFNIRNYDIQFLGGIFNKEDYIAGMGWSGNIFNAGFRGEATYFHDIDNFRDTTGMIMISASLDYTFSNSLFLQSEFLYTNRPLNTGGGLINYYTSSLNVKSLAFTEYSIFASASYPLTPLLQGSLAGMYFPKLKGIFAGPSVTYNLEENTDLGLFFQYFSGELRNPITSVTERENITLIYLRLRWNF